MSVVVGYNVVLKGLTCLNSYNYMHGKLGMQNSFFVK